MILYTTMPLDLVYPCENIEFGRQTIVSYNGIPLLVEKEEDNSHRVIRILSSDPQHFLDSRCSPGEKISFS